MNRSAILERILRHTALWEVQKRSVSGDPTTIFRMVFGSNKSTLESVARQMATQSNYRKTLDTLMKLYADIGAVTGFADSIPGAVLHRGLKGLRPTKPTHGRMSPLDLRPLILRPKPDPSSTLTLEQVIEVGLTGRLHHGTDAVEGF